MARVYLIPEFKDSVFEFFAKNYVSRNGWKSRSTLGDFPDQLQEATMVYYDVVRRYGPEIKNAKHLMAMYKRGMNIWFIDWAKYDTHEREIYCNWNQPKVTFQEHESELEEKVNNFGSNELIAVVNLILKGPEETLKLLKSDADTLFRKAVKMLGFGSKADELEKEIKAFL